MKTTFITTSIYCIVSCFALHAPAQDRNTKYGSFALDHITTGDDNTAFGWGTVYTSTESTGNTATGYNALFSTTTGNYNTADGYKALVYNTTGTFNTAEGYKALYANTTGNCNTAAGVGAGSYNDKNSLCTFLGYEADQAVTTDFSNSSAIGNNSRITASNQVRFGNSSVTKIGGQVGWTTLSDARFKKNIRENVPGLEFINLLRPVTYNLDIKKLSKFLGEDRNDREPGETFEQDAETTEAEAKAMAEKEKIVYTGFIAQEVEAAAKKIGYDFSGVDRPQNEYTPYALRYEEFVVPLVVSVQQLTKQQEEIKKVYGEKIDALLQKISDLKAKAEAKAKGIASLQQNTPNPFVNATTIHYTLPQQYTSAQIIITNKNGNVLQRINLSGKGNSSINVGASLPGNGSYHYSLVVDGKLIDTKQMILSK